jgi:GGDEF domain-containing protein
MAPTCIPAVALAQPWSDCVGIKQHPGKQMRALSSLTSLISAGRSATPTRPLHERAKFAIGFASRGRTAFPDRARMHAAGELMRQRARQAAKPLGMLVVQVFDLQELGELFGCEFAETAAKLVVDDLKHLVRNEGLAVRTAINTFTALMPNLDAQDLMEQFAERCGRTYVIEFELRRQEIVLVPSVMARRIRAAESVASAYTTLCQDIVQSRACEQRREDYLRRERESHSSRPMRLLQSPEVKPTAVRYPELPPTIRMDLQPA